VGQFRGRYLHRVLEYVTVGGLWFAVVCAPSAAQEGSASARLEKIRVEVSATEASLANLKNEFAKLKRDERTLEAAIVRLGIEEKSLVERIAELSRQREEFAVKVRAAEQRVEQQRVLIRQRLRVLYMNTTVSSQILVYEPSAQSDRERLAVYSRAVRAYDEKRFDEVKRAVAELIVARQQLEQAIQDGQRLQDEVKVKRAESEKQRAQLQSVVKEIQAKQQRARDSLALLTSEARKLEEVVQLMTGGGSEESPAEAPTPRTEPTQPSANEQDQMVGGASGQGSSPRTLAQVMSPDGLFGKRVRLVYPVRGDVLQRFGKNKVADFSDMIFNKGLEYKTPEGSQVRAVLGGQVAFAGTMPGYDTVVIIDHGARSYSLYGRLGKSFVQKGDPIGQSDVVGVTSAPDSKGRNFYFETRKNGTPVDPSSVLNSKTASTH
jgi:septal ring factor EnvC (AmiA/AmiB activator)